MVRINKATVTIKLDNRYYKTIINAKLDDQFTETMNELGEGEEDSFTFEYELSDQILVILWK